MTRHLLYIISFLITINLFGQPSPSDWYFTLFDNQEIIAGDKNTHFQIYCRTITPVYKQASDKIIDTVIITDKVMCSRSVDNYGRGNCKWSVNRRGSSNESNQTVFIIKDNIDTMKIKFVEYISYDTILSVSFKKGTYAINKIPQTIEDKNLKKAWANYINPILECQSKWGKLIGVADSAFHQGNYLFSIDKYKAAINLNCVNMDKEYPKNKINLCMAKIPPPEIILEKDSFITIRDSFSAKDSITFIAKLSKDRTVPTSCCSPYQDSLNFRYTIHCLQDERWNRSTVECDAFGIGKCYLTFINGKKYSIPPIKNPGTYYLTTFADGFIITSNQFTVK